MGVYALLSPWCQTHSISSSHRSDFSMYGSWQCKLYTLIPSIRLRAALAKLPKNVTVKITGYEQGGAMMPPNPPCMTQVSQLLGLPPTCSMQMCLCDAE